MVLNGASGSEAGAGVDKPGTGVALNGTSGSEAAAVFSMMR